MKKLAIGILIIIIVIFVFWFAGGSEKPPKTEIVISPLEQFLKENNATSEIAEAYRFAFENPQNILSKVKCYCGCLKNQKHKNNKECFFEENGNFDLMGLNCGLCVKTALISKQMLAEGKSVDEINEYIDQRWGKNN